MFFLPNLYKAASFRFFRFGPGTFFYGFMLSRLAISGRGLGGGSKLELACLGNAGRGGKNLSLSCLSKFAIWIMRCQSLDFSLFYYFSF